MRAKRESRASDPKLDPDLRIGSGEAAGPAQSRSPRYRNRPLRDLKRLADSKYGWLSEFGQFYLVGASGMVVDLSSLAALLGVGVAFPLARALSILLALTWNFALNRQLTFMRRRFGRSIAKQYLLWVVSTGLGATISWSVSVALSVFTDFFAQRVFMAAIIGIALGSVTNFVLARRWVFTAHR